MVDTKKLSILIIKIVFIPLFYFSYIAALFPASIEFDLMEEEEDIWNEILQDNQINNKSLLYASLKLYKNKLFDLSRKNFQDCINSNLSDEIIMGISNYYIGKNYFQKGYYQEAIAKFNTVLQYNLRNYNNIKLAARINTAVTYYRLNDREKCEKILQEMIKDISSGKYKDYALMMWYRLYPPKDYQKKPDKENLIAENDATINNNSSSTEEKLDSKQKPSEFIPYAKEKKMTGGMEFGQNYIMSNYCNKYGNPIYIKPYLLFYLSAFTGISLNMEYFKAKAADNSVLTFQSGTADLHLYLDFDKIFKLTATLGIGIAQTTLAVYQPSYLTTDSVDPYAVASAFAIIDFGSAHLKFGASYKRVFVFNTMEKKYVNNDLVLGSLFIGMGINF